MTASTHMDEIQREMIIAQLSSTEKKGVIRELAEFLSSQRVGVDQDLLLRVLLDREAVASTAIGHGVAIPHCRLTGLENILVCLGRSRDGIDFGSLDGKPTQIFMMVLAPEGSVAAHFKVLARMSRTFKESNLMRRLVEAPNGDEMYAALVEEYSKY